MFLTSLSRQIRIANVLFFSAIWTIIAHAANAGVYLRDLNITLDATDPSIAMYDLDVDLNGTPDFTFTAYIIRDDPNFIVGADTVDFPFASNNGVVIDAFTGNGFPDVSRLNIGGVVSAGDLYSSASFDQGNLFFTTPFDPPSGNFEGKTGFVGLRFDGNGGILYGFAEVTVNSLDASNNPLGLTIRTVGYEDNPGQSVQVITAVPEPSAIVLLSAGGVVLWVRRLRQRNAIT